MLILDEDADEDDDAYMGTEAEEEEEGLEDVIDAVTVEVIDGFDITIPVPAPAPPNNDDDVEDGGAAYVYGADGADEEAGIEDIP